LFYLGSGKSEIEFIHHAENRALTYGQDILLGFVVHSVDDEIEKLKRNKIEDKSPGRLDIDKVKYILLNTD